MVLDSEGIKITSLVKIKWVNVRSFYLRSGRNITRLKIKVIDKQEIIDTAPILASLIFAVFYEEAHVGTNISFVKGKNDEIFKAVKAYHKYYTALSPLSTDN